MAKEKKRFTELSDQELEKVNGGMGTIIWGSALCFNPTLCAAQGKQLDTNTCKCY